MKLFIVTFVIGLFAFTLTSSTRENLVSAQSFCDGMSYNTPIFATGSASQSFTMEGESHREFLNRFTGQVQQASNADCMNNAAQQFGPEAQNCAEICSSASTPQETCVGTARLHGSCQSTGCNANLYTYKGGAPQYGEIWHITKGTITCNAEGRFTVACVCRGTST